MDERQAEGIVLRTINYGEYDRILSVFTKEQGILSLFVKGGNRSKKGALALCSPLAHAEFIYRPGRKDMDYFVEGRLLTSPQQLRTDYNCLEAACSLAQALSKSQFPHKAAPQLFSLFLYYLQRLPGVSDPQVIVDSFRLKLLIHEGLIGLSSSCLHCEGTWQTVHFAEGEWYCEAHAPSQYVLSFDQDSFSYTMKISTERSFKEICKAERPKGASELIERMFSVQMHMAHAAV